MKISTRKLALTGVFTALTCVITMYLNVPNGVGGNVNAGDAVIFLCGVALGPLPTMFVGGIGSAIADLASGYAAFAPFTLVVKGLEGLIVGFASYYVFKLESRGKLAGALKVAATVGGMAIAAAWMVLGYFATSLILNSGNMAAAAGESIGNCIQAAVGVAVAAVLVYAFALPSIAKRYLYEDKFISKKASDGGESGDKPLL